MAECMGLWRPKINSPGGKNKSERGDREGEKGVSVFCFQAAVRRRSKSPGWPAAEKKIKTQQGLAAGPS